jgi:hypothetical protein
MTKMKETPMTAASMMMRMTRRMTGNVTSRKTTAPGPCKPVAARARNKFHAVVAHCNFGVAPGRSNFLPAAARGDKTIPGPGRIPIGGC